MVRLLLMAVLWFLPFWAQAAAIVAQIDRNPVALGDPVVLTFKANGMVSADPDFSPLEQDFEVRGRSQSNSFSMINGVSTISTTWELRLYPRKTGTVTIPVIQFGSDKSQSLDVQVLDQPQPTAGGAPDIFIELSAEPQQPFVQQQTIVTQRMFHVTPLEQQASLSHPPIESGKGDIEQVGNTRNTTMMRNGRNYQVIERRYALTPQQSGKLTLGRTTFEGILAEPGSNTFDPFGLSGKRIRRFSEPLTLQVQGQPASYTGKQWLPANSLTLNAHWQIPPDKLKAGEPVTLTLAIVADGLAAEQLPKLDIPIPAGIKAYTDKPELRNDAGNNGVVGVRQEKWVVVAPYNGQYDFPGIAVDWWNTSTGKQETAKVEPAKLVVTGGEAVPASPATSQPQAASTPDKQALSAAPEPDESWFSWGRFAASVLLIWVVATLAWLVWRWWQTSRSPVPQTTARISAAVPSPRKPADAKIVWKQLEQACQQNKAQASHDALVQWIGVGLNIRPALLASLREQAPPRLQAEIDALNAVLYGRSSGGWQGAALLQALQDFKPAGATHAKDSGLTALYPD
ncbi:protein BatD [Thiothrix litoralis]|uniref:Protein BatD n=1 Tax=Thiothrix litoralis TaxID=2891210 RepID=A0ABX7WZ75_9GAMM|nr:BatD family protein [Thiothrix litoralis]QTR47603.1 protein BatD [Thiothrix litoralis]